jgi:hypothetical protein
MANGVVVVLFVRCPITTFAERDGLHLTLGAIGSGIHPVLLLCVSSIRSSSSYITSISFPPVELLHADQAHSRRSSPPVLSTSVPLSPYHTSL